MINVAQAQTTTIATIDPMSNPDPFTVAKDPNTPQVEPVAAVELQKPQQLPAVSKLPDAMPNFAKKKKKKAKKKPVLINPDISIPATSETTEKRPLAKNNASI